MLTDRQTNRSILEFWILTLLFQKKKCLTSARFEPILLRNQVCALTSKPIGIPSVYFLSNINQIIGQLFSDMYTTLLRTIITPVSLKKWHLIYSLHYTTLY